MRKVSARELAELVPCALEQVGRLEELGILQSHDHGLFPSSDVHIVRLMAAFEEAGISLEDVGRGVAAGKLSFPLGLFLPEPVGASATYEGLGAALGHSPELLRRLSGELGLPPAVDDRVRAEDAEMLSLLVTTLDLAEEDELSRFAGSTTGRLGAPVLRPNGSPARRDVRALERGEGRLGLPQGRGLHRARQGLVPWLQRRHREHAVLEYIVAVTEGFTEERGITPRQPRQPPAIAFLDLTGYSTLAEERGDEAAAEVAAELASVVQEASRMRGCRPVKWLGDGVMFHFVDPASAIVTGLELVERTERAVSVPARIGIDAGAVIVQEGDYFGRTVNVAARIAEYARPREVLVSDGARQSAGVADVEFELIGDVFAQGRIEVSATAQGDPRSELRRPLA